MYDRHAYLSSLPAVNIHHQFQIVMQEAKELSYSQPQKEVFVPTLHSVYLLAIPSAPASAYKLN